MALKPIKTHLTKLGTQRTSKPDPDSILVNSLVKCMKSDFGSAFTHQHKTPDDILSFKNRLATLLMGFDVDQVHAGYDRYIYQEPVPKFPPTIPELAAFIRNNHHYYSSQKPAPTPVPQLERIKSTDPDEVIDCRTQSNLDFNKICDDEGWEKFKIKDSYSRAEIMELRKTYHEKLGMN